MDFPTVYVRHQGPSRQVIPFWLAEEAYRGYSARYGTDQSLERLLSRGGFGDGELDMFVPDWRARIDGDVEVAQTKRYLVFAGQCYEACGGMHDLHDSFDHPDEAFIEFKRLIEGETSRGLIDWAHIFDTQSRKVLRAFPEE